MVEGLGIVLFKALLTLRKESYFIYNLSINLQYEVLDQGDDGRTKGFVKLLCMTELVEITEVDKSINTKFL